MPKKFGLMFGVAGRRKKVSLFGTEFERNLNAAAYKKSGMRTRKFTRNKKTGSKIV